MITKTIDRTEMGFLDTQAELGVTKHMGGFAATNELLALCHIERAQEVLNVGCGIGTGSTYVARKYGCRVVGIDISEKMVGWSRQRAREEGVEELCTFETADVLNLPFKANSFDVVFAESVLIFVQDKARAIDDCVRVTRPGGYVGLNEAFWMKEPPPDLALLWRDATGPYVPTLERWETLWEQSGLRELVIRTHEVDGRAEIRGRIEWIGWRWLLRAWGRGLLLSLRNPALREAIKRQFGVPLDVFDYVGYALLVGEK